MKTFGKKIKRPKQNGNGCAGTGDLHKSLKELA